MSAGHTGRERLSAVSLYHIHDRRSRVRAQIMKWAFASKKVTLSLLWPLPKL